MTATSIVLRSALMIPTLKVVFPDGRVCSSFFWRHAVNNGSYPKSAVVFSPGERRAIESGGDSSKLLKRLSAHDL